jgi:hypothetical protein
MRKNLAALCSALGIFLLPAVAWEASVSKNLAIQVTAGQTPTAVSFSPAGPVSVNDSASAGTVISAVQVSTNDGQPFAGTVSITDQSVSGMVSLSSSTLPSSVQIASINSSDDGTQTVSVQACENGACTSPATLTMNVASQGGGGSILPPDRNASANWQMAGMLSVGGIPNRTTICATVHPIGAGADDATNIQNAIGACPAGQVVLLSAGTFTIAEGNYLTLNKGITVRGAGAGNTILQRTNGAHLEPGAAIGSNPSPLIILGPARWGVWAPDGTSNSTNLTADALKGANSVTVASPAHFSVGQIVLLDEVSGAGWQPDVTGTATSVWAAPDYRVTWRKHNPSQSNDDFDANSYPYQPNTNGDQYSRLDRPTNEIKEIPGTAMLTRVPTFLTSRMPGSKACRRKTATMATSISIGVLIVGPRI